MALPTFRPEFKGMPTLTRRAQVAPPASGSRQFKVLLSSHAPQQLSLFALAAPAAQPKGSRTA